MRKSILFILSLLLLLISAQPLWAENEVKEIAVLPFTVHSSEDIEYVKNGVWDMLISRVSASDEITVLDKHRVMEELQKIGKEDLTAADIYGFGKRLDIDYVIWGSITKIGNTVSLDGKLLDVSTYKTPVGIFEQCRGIDDVIPKISNFARKINSHVLGEASSSLAIPSTPEKMPQGIETADSGAAQKAEAVDVLKTDKGTFTSIVNPSFVTTSSPVKMEGSWMSQRYRNKFKGMAIGDVNNDGLKEVVLIDSQNVMIYQRRGEDLKLLNTFSGKAYDNYLAVDVADINGNDLAEIIISNIKNNRVDSFVLEYDGKKFTRIASGLKWFFRVVMMQDMPVLLGQKKGLEKPFDTPIYDMIWKKGEYEEGKRMSIPKGLSVFGLGMDSVEGSGIQRVLALDEYDHLCIYRKTKKELSLIHVIGGSDDLAWKSGDVYGGTTNYFDYGGSATGNYASGSEHAERKRAYVNTRILTFDLDKNGKKEIIIIKNMGTAGRVMTGVKAFTRSEIYDLEWDGLGMAEQWKTKKIQGYVADYQIEDINNDGKKEIVLIVRLSRTRSVIVAYDLKI
ncbi:MAG: VCBS repeat-containing protein [Deltaproteobacteria bacterium]|nr:VCBS repeat-containing protein [Deltaproteobacteria bacterium]